MSDQDDRTEDTPTTGTEDQQDATTDSQAGATDTVTLSKAEADALRRQAAEGQKAKRQAQKAAEEAARKRAEEEGNWKKIAEEAEAKMQAAEKRLLDAERSRTISSKADLLKFRDPETAEVLVRRKLSDEELDDPALVERALKAIAKEKDWLLRPEQRRTGAAIRGDDGETDEKDPMVGIAKQIHSHLAGGSRMTT